MHIRFGRSLRLVALLALGLASVATNAHADKASGTLEVALVRSADGLDVHQRAVSEALFMSQHIFDSLLYYDNETAELKPALAQSWKWIDPTTMELALRKGVTFHDGQPFDADDVVGTINFVINPESQLPSMNRFDWIKAIEKVDQFTVRIVLKAPNSAAPTLLNGIMILPHVYSQKEGYKVHLIRPVGTGPYKLESVDAGAQNVLLVRNDKYFADSPKGVPTIDRIQIRVIPEIQTQVAELLAGTLEFAFALPVDQVEFLARDPRLSTANAPSSRFVFMLLDAAGRSGFEPLKKLKVRQAIAAAINREGIAERIVRGGSKVIDSFCVPGQTACDPSIKMPAYDPENAKALLKAAGYENGFDLPMVTYDNSVKAAVEVIQADLAKVGIRMSAEFVSPSRYFPMLTRGEMRSVIFGWAQNATWDLGLSIPAWFDGSARDYARNPEVTELVKEAVGTIDVSERDTAFTRALQLISDQALVVPMFTVNSNYVFTKDLSFTPGRLGYPMFVKAKWN